MIDLLEVKIETDRLFVKPITKDYREVIYKEFTPEITYYMYPKSPKNISDIDKFIDDSLKGLKDGSNFQSVIVDKKTGEFFGCLGLHDLDQKNFHMGIWLKKSAHGKAYGKEAANGVSKWAKDNLEFDYFVYPVAEKNIASRKVAESLGGKIARKYFKKMLTGRTWYMLEYRIYKNKN